MSRHRFNVVYRPPAIIRTVEVEVTDGVPPEVALLATWHAIKEQEGLDEVQRLAEAGVAGREAVFVYPLRGRQKAMVRFIHVDDDARTDPGDCDFYASGETSLYVSELSQCEHCHEDFPARPCATSAPTVQRGPAYRWCSGTCEDAYFEKSEEE